MKTPFLFLCGLAMSASLSAQTIVPDRSFSSDGKLIQSISTGFDAATSVVLQPDGKIIAAIELYDDGNIGLMRLNRDGSPDASFGISGIVMTDMGITEQATAIALQPDGKIVVGGVSSDSKNPDMLILRYHNDGSLDAGFGSGGAVIIDMGLEESVRALALAPDGKIVISGETSSFIETKMLLVRLNTNGSLDKSFDVDGRQTHDNAMGLAVAVQSDKKILVSGNDYYTIRYKENGSIDSSFGKDGITSGMLPLNGICKDILVQPDGAILLGGMAYNGSYEDFGLTRLNPDGSLDAGFGSGGYIMTNFGYGPEHNKASVSSLLYQPDGKILAAGSSFASAGSVSAAWFALVRYDHNGSLDAGFNGTGYVLEQMGNDLDYCNDAVLQPDGRIVLVGQSLTKGEYNTAFLRLAGDSSLSIPAPAATSFRAAVHPNILHPDSRLQLNLNTAATTSADLYSMDGRFILRAVQPEWRSAGAQQVSLHALSGIAPGQYILQVSCGQERIALPLLQQ